MAWTGGELTKDEQTAVVLVETCRTLDATSAAEKSMQFLSTLRSKANSSRVGGDGWSDKYVDVVRVFLDACVKLRTSMPLRNGLSCVLSLVNQKQKINVLGTELLYLQAQARACVVKAAEGGNDSSDSDEEEDDQILGLLTGIPRSEIASNRQLSRAMNFYIGAVNAALTVIRDWPKYEVYYHRIIANAFHLIREQDRKFEYSKLSKLLETHTNITFDRADFRAEIEKNEEAQKALVEARHAQLEAAIALKHWRGILPAIEDWQRVNQAFRRWGKVVLPEDARRNWSLLARAFFAAENYTFHAVCLSRLAQRLRVVDGVVPPELSEVASQALLATLCVSQSVVDGGALSTAARDSSYQKDTMIAKAFNFSSTPTREYLLIQMNKPSKELAGKSIIDFASPDVRALYAKLGNVSSVLVCGEVAPILARLEGVATFRPYIRPLQEYAVRALLQIISKSFSRVSIDHLCQLCTFYPRDSFAVTLEPLLLDTAHEESGTIVSIDYGAGAVNFTDGVSSSDRIASIQTTLSYQLSQAAAPCFGLTPAAPTIPGVMQAMESDRDRILARNAICRLRGENSEQRLAQREEQEKKRREEAQQKKQEMEQRRIEKQRNRDRAKLMKQVAEQEGVERRRWVLKALMQKYKSFEPPMSLANLPQEKFIEALAPLLCSYRRETEMRREGDVRLMEHFELSCREVEAPLRRRRDEELVVSTRVEAQKRRENAIRKHKEDYEKAIAIKERLVRLAAHKAAYEKELFDVINSKLQEKNRKRDEEQAELDRMMREREERAAAAAAASGVAPPPPAAAAAPAPSSASSEAPRPTPPPITDTLPSSAGKWVPKSRKQ